MTGAVLRLSGVSVERDGRRLLDGIDWAVGAGERWVVLGPNGSGKTTLLRVASMYLHPTTGSVEVAGATLGRVDVRQHRRRIGFVSAALADQLRPGIGVLDAVMAGRYAALETWWHEYDDADREEAMAALGRLGIDHLHHRTFGTLSSGERQRVLLARSLLSEPALLLLDEPMAGLDLGAREDLVARLASLAADPTTPPVVLVTHHVDEVPPGFTHCLLLRDGRAVAAGALVDVLTARTLSEAFGLALELERRHDRWVSWAPPG